MFFNKIISIVAVLCLMFGSYARALDNADNELGASKVQNFIISGNYCIYKCYYGWVLIEGLPYSQGALYFPLTDEIELFGNNDRYVWGKDKTGYFVHQIKNGAVANVIDKSNLSDADLFNLPVPLKSGSGDSKLHDTRYFSDEASWREYLTKETGLTEYSLISPDNYVSNNILLLSYKPPFYNLGRVSDRILNMNIAGKYYIFRAYDSLAEKELSWDIGYLIRDSSPWRWDFVQASRSLIGYGYSGDYMYGQDSYGFFVFKMIPEHDFFKDEKQCLDALDKSLYNCVEFEKEEDFAKFLAERLGIKEYKLLKPDVEFDKLPQSKKYPWLYCYFGGFLNMPDDAFALLLVLISGITTGALAFKKRKYKLTRKALIPGFVLGLVVGFIMLNNADLACGSIFSGLIVSPLLALFSAKLTYGMMDLLSRPFRCARK